MLLVQLSSINNPSISNYNMVEYVGGEKMVVVVVNVVDDGPTALCNNGLYYVLSTN